MAKNRTYGKGSKKGTTNTRNQKAGDKSNYKDEITLLVIILISVLMLLSVFNAGGKVGEWVGGFLFGLFGFMAYLFPFLLFFATAFYALNSSSKPIKRKVSSGMFLYLCLISLIEWLAGRSGDVVRLTDYFKLSRETRRGGGFIGGLVNHVLQFLFGRMGTLAILLIVSLILIVILTGKLFLAMLKEKTIEHMESRRRELEEEAEEEADAPNREETGRRKAKTVTFDKGSKKGNGSSDDMTEIFAKGVENLETPIMEDNGIPPEDSIRNDLESLTIERPKDVVIEEGSGDKAVTEIGERTKNPQAIDAGVMKKEKDPSSEMTGSPLDEAVMESLQEESIPYQFPPTNLLSPPKRTKKGMSDHELKDTAFKIQTTLESFGVHVKMSNISCGPSVTRYEIQPEQGVKISKITSLSDDIKLNLAAADIRIEAPIPGKSAVGIEVPNSDNATVFFREMIESEEFKNHKSNLAFAVGKDIGGNVIISDISKMPHLLIAGATGSGKSVCINTIIMSILYKANPNDVKLIMVDPKVVELNVYNGIPHLLTPVVTDPKKASSALNWAVVEMTNRYKQFAELGVRDINGFNKKVDKMPQPEEEGAMLKMPQIVIIVDELSDLMMVAPGEVEDSICRLAQMARAAGIHLILATQRPSVNVITGLIKANVPSRIAFAVSSGIDSRTILDGYGAEKLLGKGDMLFFPSGYPKPVRIQGNFISDKEVGKVVEYIKSQYEGPVYDENVSEEITSVEAKNMTESAAKEECDPYFEEVGRFIIEKDKASIGLLQRVFRIGFNRAARIMDQLCEAGVVGPEEGTKPRRVLMTMEEFEQYLKS